MINEAGGRSSEGWDVLWIRGVGASSPLDYDIERKLIQMKRVWLQEHSWPFNVATFEFSKSTSGIGATPEAE